MRAQLGKLVLIALERPGTVIFTYSFDNFPQRINTSTRANWEAQEVTIGVKPLFYSNREPIRINIDELWLDRTETNESVGPDITALRSFQIETDNEGTPPILLAIWGDNQERVVLEEVNVEEQFFTPDGDPMRARVSLVLVGAQEEHENVSVRITEEFEP